MARHRLFTDTHKWCPRCKAMQPHSAFDSHTISYRRPSGLQDYCREHQAVMSRASWLKWKASPKGKAHRLRLMVKLREERALKLLAEAKELESLATQLLREN